MRVRLLSHIDALIEELKALKANTHLLQSKGESIEAQIEQIRAMLKPESVSPERKKAGWAKGFVTYMADDFDAPIDDMAAYS